MKLILRADVDNLGHLGDIVEVKPGFGRNYLVPQGLAMTATKGNLKAFELERKKLQSEMDSIKSAAQELADKLVESRAIVRVRVGEGDRMYGSVTTANVVDELLEMGIEVDRKKIVLGDPIRALGEYTLPVKLHPDVTCEIKVAVVRHNWVEGEPITIEEAELAASEAKAAALAEEKAAEVETTEEVTASDDAEQADEQPTE
ncbi:50S ribosomal protein L9 [Desulfovibrio ferrophilus]|uniref:Large ribosomal subunit protein bL9 n=1 Tax=Desulfovibrio ferrophilus TaxID=241368 RepID=A0A2Z6AXI9_9BACT|nr:50S ribosomal protein L9 [Desulfovibrio ferrophilus]BBD07951.1 50S ribosomal protein L9 [Desulfovibrio ferrophilus]